MKSFYNHLLRLTIHLFRIAGMSTHSLFRQVSRLQLLHVDITILAQLPPLYKSAEEIEGLRKAGRFNAQVMDFIRPHVKVGVTSNELNDLVHEYTLDHGHTPACLGYPGHKVPFPKSICTSVNDVVCHGVPNDIPLKEGDIINVDLTSIVEGWHGDSSEMFMIGEVSPTAKRLVQVTFDALHVGIDAIRPFGRVTDIGTAIYRFARQNKFGVVKQYQGHGVGRKFHQKPDVPHYPEPSLSNCMIPPGVCFTIEPMLNEGTGKTNKPDADGWTVRTKDRKLSAQFEHTILMTEKGPEILTLTENGPQKGDTLGE